MNNQTSNVIQSRQSSKQAITITNQNNNHAHNSNQQQNYNSKQFDKIRVLGKGSFGIASVNRRRTDCSLVVLKEIDLSKFKGERERQSAINEARIMSTLNHSNIIKYYNAYTTDTKLIIEMEYASIGTLAAFLSLQSQQLEEQEILVIFRQITLGLNYLHSRQIIHLDLKMTNIFVTIEGFIKIGDFGIAQYLSSNLINSFNNNNAKINTANSAAHLGTLAYSSPERCIGAGEPDFKSDIWSLGCILYELITSKPLFGSESLSELIISITKIQYQPIKRNITSLLKDIFEQMIARHPDDRPAAKDLLLIINQLLTRIQQQKSALINHHKRQQNNHYQHHRFDLSTEMGQLNLNQNHQHFVNEDIGLNQINYPHSFVYQVRLSSPNIHLDRVNLPPTKRIREIIKGKSHYLVLTYDNIVYGWGTKSHGQLGSCGLLSSSFNPSSFAISTTDKVLRGTRSARSSVNAKDLHLFASHNGQLSITTPHSPASSLASSTQTINQQQTTPTTSSQTYVNKQQAASTSAKQQFANLFLNKQLIMTALAESKPTTKPMVINELNNRKIIQVAAGNNFSVFLSKTGIVMTCGDGSTGCLGRGDLKSSYTPCMVESLLNSDVVSIASGPEHVVAVCGNGKAFAWGKNRDGRLGIPQNHFNNNGSKLLNNRHNNKSPKYVTKAQQIHFRQQSSISIYYSSPTTTISAKCDNNDNNNFNLNNIDNNFNNNNDDNSRNSNQVDNLNDDDDNDVLIKSVFCGDKCTIFIDSNNRCWACGDNRSNRLGLDLKRRFKKTLIIDKCWQPSEILALSKYKIITCSIGKNHTTFLTNDGKIIVFGQDIDYTYRLKRNIICGRDSHRRISFELQTTSKQQYNFNNKRRNLNSNYSILDGSGNGISEEKQFEHSIQQQQKRFPTTNYKYLIKSMIAHNQLINFKQQSICNLLHYNSNNYQKYNLSKSQRQKIDSYIRKSRSSRKMPIDCAISVSCRPKFTLALSNDNRIYFWGIRTYKKDESLYSLLLKQQQLIEQTQKKYSKNKTTSKEKNKKDKDKQQTSVEPQLVANCSDECFIKIGATNNSLMSNIQLLGSDQPIIHAQDPRLIAQSLADLWILDYKPYSTFSFDNSSLSSSSSSTISNQSCLSSTSISSIEETSNEPQLSLCSSCSSTPTATTGELTCCCHNSQLSSSCSSSSSYSSSCSKCKQIIHKKTNSMVEEELSTLKNTNNDNNENMFAYFLDKDDCFKHDAILQAQPIVSLYVPSMFSHSGCSVNLVDLFCFDDDRFYLVLDTTVKLQQHNHTSYQSSQRMNVAPIIQQQQQSAAAASATTGAGPTTTTPPMTGSRTRINSIGTNKQFESQNKNITSAGKQQHRQNDKIEQSMHDCVEQKLNILEPPANKSTIRNVESCCSRIDELEYQTNGINSIKTNETNQAIQKKDLIDDNNYLNITEERVTLYTKGLKSNDNNNNNLNTSSASVDSYEQNETHHRHQTNLAVSYHNSTEEEIIINCNSQCGISIEEPKSLSTFGASHIIIGPTMRISQQEQSLEPLNFENELVEHIIDENAKTVQTELSDATLIPSDGDSKARGSNRVYAMMKKSNNNQNIDDNQLEFQNSNINDRIKQNNKSILVKRSRKASTNKSESTTFTCNEFDETSSMPSWVRNEYIQQQQQQQIIDSEPNNLGLFQVDSSTTEDTYMSDVSLTISGITLASEYNNQNQITVDKNHNSDSEPNEVIVL